MTERPFFVSLLRSSRRMSAGIYKQVAPQGAFSVCCTAIMIKALQSEIGINVVASIIASIVFLAAGFIWGKYKERRRKFGRNLEEYDFYSFTVTRENFGEFSLKDFRLGMHYFLKNEDHTAARQLIFIGEQNNVRTQLEPTEQKV